MKHAHLFAIGLLVSVSCLSGCGPRPTQTLAPLPVSITSHPVDPYAGQCLDCHGKGKLYQYPLPPSWDGGYFDSTNNPGLWSVPKKSIADHTGRTVQQCLTCHKGTD